MVSLADPMQPRIVGTLAGGGFLAISDAKILLSSGHFYESARKLRSAALEAVAAVTRVTMTGLTYNETAQTDQTEREVQVEFRVVPTRYEVTNATVEIARAGTPISTLNAVLSGSSGTAIWPAAMIVDRNQAYTARVTVNPQAERPLRSASAPVPLVEWVFVNQRGEETLAPLQSNPKPIVTLEPVGPGDVTIMSGGETGQVRIRGEVTDAVADLTPRNAADVTRIEIAGHSLPVSRIEERASLWRPHAFRGRFEGTVSIELTDGRNNVVARAVNAVGGQGYDSVTLNIEQTLSKLPNPAAPRVADGRFSTPFTIVVQPLSSEVADSVVVYRGLSAPTGTETPLVETSANSRVFEGITSIGPLSLRLPTEIQPNALVRGAFSADVTNGALLLEAHGFSFVESEPGSGIYRSPARRLPSNRVLTIAWPEGEVPEPRRQLRAAVGALEADLYGTLQETAQGSSVFVGSIADVGAATVTLISREGASGEFGRLRVVVESDETTSPIFLELRETQTGSLRYSTDVEISADVGMPAESPTPVATRLTSVQQNQAATAGRVDPVFLAAKGLRALPIGAVASIDGRPLEMVTAPILSAAGTSGEGAARVRLAGPVLLVTERSGQPLPGPVLVVDEAAAAAASLAAISSDDPLRTLRSVPVRTQGRTLDSS